MSSQYAEIYPDRRNVHFAVSVGFSLGNDIYTFPGGMQIVLMEGTGVAIDDNHILSSAHVFKWPVDQLGPAPKGLKYRIHVRHDYKIKLSTLEMLILSEPGIDFEVNIAAWADGAPTDQIREAYNTNVTLNNDLVLLNSPPKLTRLNPSLCPIDSIRHRMILLPQHDRTS